MRRTFTIAVVVLAIAVVTGGCRQIWAHRTRKVTITTYTIEGPVEGNGPFVDGQPVNISGTAKDWGDTYPMPQNPWQCVGMPTTAAAVATDCVLGQFSDGPQNEDGSFLYGDEMMRHIQTARSGWVDCALTACSVVVQASGPYYCGGIFEGPTGDRQGCWKDPQPGDAFTVYQPVPITFLRTPETTPDCDRYTDLVDDHGQAFPSRDACAAWVANSLAQRPEIHINPSTGLRDGWYVDLTGVRLTGAPWNSELEAWVQECVGTPHDGFSPPQECTPAVEVGRYINEDDGTFNLHLTVARYIPTVRNGLVDCAATPCTMVVRNGASSWPYVYIVASTPITFAADSP